MNDTIKLVLSLSLSGSILALLILVLRPLIRHKVPKSMQYLLWIVVLFRFLIPYSFEGSIMNELFYKSDMLLFDTGSRNTIVRDTHRIEKTTNSQHFSESSDSSVSQGLSLSHEKAVDNFLNIRAHFIAKIKSLFSGYALYIWILGFISFLIYNLSGYVRFLKQIKKANLPATDLQNQILNLLLDGHYRLKLFRNTHVKAPMLIGILRPRVVIPDTDYSKKQLKYILLHEISHMRRLDIAVKWLTMIVQCIHWFNPLIYPIGKEVNHACELACDEAVIRNLNAEEKQDYGNTLIDVATGGKCHPEALHATMYEEKHSLKDRLTAIMNHSKKTKAIILLSVVLFISIAACALYLGVGVGTGTPPNIYINVEYEETKTAVIGTYSWNSVCADSISPPEIKYKPDNIVNISSGQQLSLSTQKLKIDRKFDFTLKNLTVFNDGKKVMFEAPAPSIMNGVLYIQAPVDGGEYIYDVTLDFENKGQVRYSFIVRVDMTTFNLDQISKFKTLCTKESWKISDMAQNMPVPDKSFNQRHVSLSTDKQPYGLTVFYEIKYDGTYISEWPLIRSDRISYSNMQKNALVLFCMIDDLGNVTFAFRDSPSNEKLDETKYDSKFTFLRSDFEGKYGDLSVLGKDLKLLRGVLEGKNVDIKAIEEANNKNKPEFSDKEIHAAAALIEEYFRAVKAKDDKAILKTLTPGHDGPNVRLYGEETRTLISCQFASNDPKRYSYVWNGRGKMNGTKVENVIVFKAKFNVKYPNGVVSGPYNEGDYSDWSMILVRKDKNSPWLIDDQGY